MRRTLNTAEVAEMLGKSRAWFYRHRGELRAAGFPEPLPVIKRWNIDQVSDWLQQAATRDQVSATVAESEDVTSMQAWRQRLEGRLAPSNGGDA